MKSFCILLYKLGLLRVSFWYYNTRQVHLQTTLVIYAFFTIVGKKYKSLPPTYAWKIRLEGSENEGVQPTPAGAEDTVGV